jgi:hypothetical protein
LATEALTPDVIRGGEIPAKRFDPKSASPFINKSVSEETRRAYGRAVREFFQSADMKHPSEVVPADVLLRCATCCPGPTEVRRRVREITP